MDLVNQVKGTAMAAIGLARPWSSDLCDCSKENQSCLDVFCCYPCQISRQCAAIDGVQDYMDYCYCILAIVGTYWYWGPALMSMIIRYRIIEKFRISGEGPISTFCKGSLCFPCSLCQTNRELMLLGMNPSGTCYRPPAPAPQQSILPRIPGMV